jgi:RNA polymerase sigma-70 factor (ECF subfamily)
MTEERFSDFFASNFADVWRFARRRTDSESDADDITAETFAVAWRRRADMPADADRLWLFGVARNVLANHRRHAERQRRLHLRIVTVDAPRIAYELAAGSEESVWESFSDLSDDDRELLLLRAWDDLSVNEIAIVLQVSAAKVSSRLYKARNRLQQNIDRRDPAATGHVQVESRGKGSSQ